MNREIVIRNYNQRNNQRNYNQRNIREKYREFLYFLKNDKA